MHHRDLSAEQFSCFQSVITKETSATFALGEPEGCNQALLKAMAIVPPTVRQLNNALGVTLAASADS